MKQLLYILEAEKCWHKKGGSEGFRAEKNWSKYVKNATKRSIGKVQDVPSEMGDMAPGFGKAKVAFDRNYGRGYSRKGFLIFGPNYAVPYPPKYLHGVNRLGRGQYLATFNLYVDCQYLRPHDNIVVLDCCHDKGRKVLSQNALTPHGIEQMTGFDTTQQGQVITVELPVFIPRLVQHLETRVFWTGVGLVGLGHVTFHRIIH
ncbi:MAG: hypothetical protein AAFO69_01695 [Bacteroidota bacterium]